MAEDKSTPIFTLRPASRRAKEVIARASGAETVKTGQVPQEGYALTTTAAMPVSFDKTAQLKTSQVGTTGANIIHTQPMFFSPLHTPQNWQIAARRKEVYQWSRFYYENEAKVAAGIDFYAQFPMNGFSLECKDGKILRFYERLAQKLNLNYWFKKISHEYFLLGDVFPFLEIDCPYCKGDKNPTEDMKGEPCRHPDGTFSRILVLNPDWIEVHKSQLAEEAMIVLLPDEELKSLVQRKQPRNIYDQLPDVVKNLVATGRPIPLSNRAVSHLKHNGRPYGTYGESLLRRLFVVLAYKTKLMTANWIVAERMILPIRIVKVGSEARPAGEDDIQDVANQLAAVANDPNLAIITHHAFEYDWIGATGKIHNITAELELIGKEILDGLMLNQALLNGEMGGYQNAQVGVETMIRRLEAWRQDLAEWAEENIFLPVAQMQGFIDKEASEDAGEPVYMYAKVVFNDMKLRDKSNNQQLLMQLHDKQIISTQELLKEFDIDYDTMVRQIREEQIMAGPMGQVPMEGGMGGGMPPGGGMGGGFGGPPGMEGDMAGGMGGMDGGMGMGGGMGDAGGGMGGGMGAAAETTPRVFKRGKEPKKEEEEIIPFQPKMLALTKPEMKLYKVLQSLKIPFAMNAQYKVAAPGKEQPYAMDFAYPEIYLDIEADGEMWHTMEDDKEGDRKRDLHLASMGWRVLRFNERAINEQIEAVSQSILQNAKEAAKEKRAISRKSNIEGNGKSLKKVAKVHKTALGAVISGETASDEGSGENF